MRGGADEFFFFGVLFVQGRGHFGEDRRVEADWCLQDEERGVDEKSLSYLMRSMLIITSIAKILYPRIPTPFYFVFTRLSVSKCRV